MGSCFFAKACYTLSEVEATPDEGLLLHLLLLRQPMQVATLDAEHVVFLMVYTFVRATRRNNHPHYYLLAPL